MTRTRLLSVTLATSLLLVQAGGVLAQTPPPIERTPEMEEYAAEIAAQFPEAIGGVSLLDDLDISVGQELIGELDPSDPDDAEEIALFEEIVVAAGATLDDAATASSYALLDEDEYTYATVIAFRVRDGDIEPTVPLFVAAFEKDIPDALVEQEQVGDEDVTVLRSAEDPDAGEFVILARGDTLWLLAVPPEILEETVGSLPES